MKRLCFGTLLILMYQARGQSVTYKKICDAVFTAYGCDGMAVRDKSLPGHLKTGHDNVPPDVVSAARNMPFEDAIDAFEQGVSPLIKETNVKPFIHAIRRLRHSESHASCLTAGGYFFCLFFKFHTPPISHPYLLRTRHIQYENAFIYNKNGP